LWKGEGGAMEVGVGMGVFCDEEDDVAVVLIWLLDEFMCGVE
jgi:hypothetical protein